MKDRNAILAELPQLLPLAAQWAAEEEQRILREGVPLTPDQLDDARAVGVREPERVRLLRIDEIPLPKNPMLRAAAEAVHFLSPETRGLTLQYGIFLRWDCWGQRHLVVHELAHTMQYERLGGILPFLREYIQQCVTIGYANAPMELEVCAIAAKVCPA